MDRRWRLDLVRDIPAEDRHRDRRRRAAGRASVLRGVAEHDRVVRAARVRRGARQVTGLSLRWRLIALVGLGGVALQAGAGMAQHAERSRAAGVDIITYHTEVRDVVDLIGYLPAGDAMAGSGNAAVPTLTGMMLDRGTRTQDQFTIARQLEEVGAEIAYNVGTQTLQFEAKCLKKDLPLVLSILSSELRAPAFSPAEFAKVRQQLIGMIDNRMHSTEARAKDVLRQALFPVGHPNRLATTEELLAAARSA